jgi:hypothetical protein
MRYIKPLNEYNNDKLYHKITISEYNSMVEKSTYMEPKAFTTLSDKFDITKGSNDRYVTAVTFNRSDRSINIWQLEDEYFAVCIKNNNPAKYYELETYKCDSIEGVIQLLNNIYETY